MPNEMELFKTQRPAAAFQTLNPQESLAEGIGSSYGVIGYKGKVWTLRYRGEKHVFVRPDDGTPVSYIDVIILRQAHQKSKSYYLDYNEGAGEGARPVCSSLNGVVPDNDVQQKQSDTCALCPRNVWKTDASGRKTRECTDYKRLAVLLLPAATKALLGQSLMEPVFLRIPPASLNDLAVMGETMAGQGWHFSSFITRITFDPTQAYPKMTFKPLQGLTDAEAPVVLQFRNDPQASRITGEDQANNPPALNAPVARPMLPGNPPSAQPQPVAHPQPQTQQAAVAQARAEALKEEPVSSGLLDLTANTTVSPAIVPPPTQTAAIPTAINVTPAQESDPTLDARIANLLKTS